MHPIRNRALCAILTVLIGASTLMACGKPADNSAVTTPAPSVVDTTVGSETTPPEETKIVPNLPAANFGGHKFTVLTRGTSSEIWYSRDIYAEGVTGEVISDAVYKRNKKIEQQYNFEVVEIGSKKPADDAKNSIMAQLDEYDMLCFRLKDHLTSMMTSGYLHNLNDVELLNLDQPYYDQNSRKNLSLGGKLFAVTGGSADHGQRRHPLLPLQ